MRATQVVARGRVEFIEMPPPLLKPGHAMISPLLVALCGSDLHRVYYAADDEYPHAPGTPGHEMVGVVESVDAPGHTIKPGDVALVITPTETVMCEHYLAPADDVLVLPAGRPIDHMLMGQQLGTAVYAAKRFPNLVGKDVAVIGQGSAGLFLDFMCRRLGARRIIGIDRVAARVAASSQFGATAAVNNAAEDALQAVSRITNGRLADLVIEAAGDADAINLAPHLVKQNGYLHFFGIPRAQVFPFDFDAFFRKYAHTTTLSGTALEPGRQSFRQALDMIAAGEIDVTPALTHRLLFEQVIEGLEMARTCADGAIKVVIEMPGLSSL